MCCMTVFLTVSFITFLSGVGKLAPLIVLKNSVFTSGDNDIIILGGETLAHKEIVPNNNFYTEEQSFWDEPFMSNNDKLNVHAMTAISALPLVNYTDISALIDQEYKNRTKPIELFPRWFAQTKLYNENREFHTQAYVFAGDSRLERNIRIAPGFPNNILGKDEMITTHDVMSLLNINVGDMVEADIDLF